MSDEYCIEPAFCFGAVSTAHTVGTGQLTRGKECR